VSTYVVGRQRRRTVPRASSSRDVSAPGSWPSTSARSTSSAPFGAGNVPAGTGVCSRRGP